MLNYVKRRKYFSNYENDHEKIYNLNSLMKGFQNIVSKNGHCYFVNSHWMNLMLVSYSQKKEFIIFNWILNAKNLGVMKFLYLFIYTFLSFLLLTISISKWMLWFQSHFERKNFDMHLRLFEIFLLWLSHSKRNNFLILSLLTFWTQWKHTNRLK